MDAKTYAVNVENTCGMDKPVDRLVGSALGLAGEAGEVADHIKKAVFHAHELDKAHVAEELGDILWYVVVMAHTVDYSLEDIMQLNHDKLRKRYPNGFDPERSKNREPETSLQVGQTVDFVDFQTLEPLYGKITRIVEDGWYEIQILGPKYAGMITQRQAPALKVRP